MFTSYLPCAAGFVGIHLWMVAKASDGGVTFDTDNKFPADYRTAWLMTVAVFGVRAVRTLQANYYLKRMLPGSLCRCIACDNCRFLGLWDWSPPGPGRVVGATGLDCHSRAHEPAVILRSLSAVGRGQVCKWSYRRVRATAVTLDLPPRQINSLLPLSEWYPHISG